MRASGEAAMRLYDSDFVFHEANSTQKEQSWRLNSLSWKGPMSLEQYVDREIYLENQELCSNGRCKYWVLSSANGPSEIIASCETTQKSVLVGGENGLEILKGYSIASVYTNPKYRRQGMAALLVQHLKEWFDTTGEADLSVLYSDIGKEYYSKLGWRVFPSMLTFIEVLNGNTEKITSQTNVLDKEAIRELCHRDVANVSQELLKQQRDKSVCIAFEPSFEQVSWHFARAEYTAQTLLGRVPQNFGAITESRDSWIYWFHDFRANELVIQRFVLWEKKDNQQQLIADTLELLSAAVTEAESWNMKQVIVWNLPVKYVEQATPMLQRRFKDKIKLWSKHSESTSIPSLRLKDGKDSSNVKWIHNEYYAWC